MNARALLGASRLRPKKRLGQHFLMDAGTAARIARLAVDGPATILEIGAGTGTLSAALVGAGARLTAFDVDPALVAILRSRPDLHDATLLAADALSFDYAAWSAGRPWSATGNLPYNIATPLLVRLAQLDAPPERTVVMLQRDVADRLLARPGTPRYGSLTLAVAVTMQAERAFNVPPEQFYPRPNVVSSVLVLRRRERPVVAIRDRQRFEQVVRAAFAYRRKTLANSLALALGVPRERVASVLHALRLDADIRGEALDLPTFVALADALAA